MYVAMQQKTARKVSPHKAQDDGHAYTSIVNHPGQQKHAIDLTKQHLHFKGAVLGRLSSGKEDETSTFIPKKQHNALSFSLRLSQRQNPVERQKLSAHPFALFHLQNRPTRARKGRRSEVGELCAPPPSRVRKCCLHRHNFKLKGIFPCLR